MNINKIIRSIGILLLTCSVPLTSLGGDLKIVVFSVGSGDSSLIQFPNGKMMLIDTGVPARTLDTVIPFLQLHGITHLDYFLGTHVHPDHTDGIPNLQAAGYIDAATIVWDWNTFDIYDSFTLEETAWLIYNARNTALNTDDTNFNSVSYRIEWNGFVYSGTGDEGTASMNRFLNDYPALVPCHVRNTAHHAYGPTSSAFLTALNARLYIVSCSTEISTYAAYKTIGTVATNVGGVRALTETCASGARGHVYVRASSATNWNYEFYPINNVIPNFYTPPPNNAKFISQNVPETLMPGETATVSVTLENTGPGTWSTATGYALGSRNPADNTTWTGSSRVALPHDVATGQQVTFSFDISAPTNIAFYNFQWQMIHDGESDPDLKWFGSATSNASIDVTWPLINLVQNPSFELDADSNGLPDSWGNNENYTRSSVQKSAGSYSVKGVGSGSIGGISQTMAIVTNTEYELSVKMYYASGTGTVVFDTSDKFDAEGNQFALSATNGGWTKFSGSFNSGTNTSVTLRTYTSSLSNGVHYVDEVSLTTRSLYEIPNLPPQFTSSPVLFAEVGSGYSYTVTTDDLNDDPVTLSVVSKPAWLNLSSNALSGTPVAVGSNSVTLRAADAFGHRDQTFTITVSAAGNDAPVITSVPNTGVIENSAYGYIITAADPDGDLLTYAAPVKPSWLSLSGNMLSGTPTSSDIGIHPITMTVNDGTVTATQKLNVVVFVTQPPDNLFLNGSFESGTTWPSNWIASGVKPTWSTANAQHGTKCMLVSNDIGDVSQLVMVEEGKTYNLSVWIDASGYLKTNASSGTVVFDSRDVYDDPGECQFVVTSTNFAPGWTQKTGSFTATNTAAIQFRIFSSSGAGGTIYFDNIVLTTTGSGNDTPIFTSVPVTNVDQYATYQYRLLAADAENSPLTFSGDTVPSWLQLQNGVLSGIPPAAGSFPVVLSVSDGTASTNQSFTITVNAIIQGYDAWAATNGVGEATADDDGDGRENLLEYAIGGNPNSGTDENTTPALTTTGSGLEYSHKKRNDDPNLTYRVQTCTDLIAKNWVNAEVTPVVTGTVGPYDDVKYTIAVDQPHSYIRLTVQDQ